VHDVPSLQGVPVSWVPVHTPAWHESGCVQELPSSHGVPVRGAPQAPDWHVSGCVQELPSSHAAPSFGVWTHPLSELQESLVHGLTSSQLRVECPHPDAMLHQSTVQALPSSQLAVNAPKHCPTLHVSFEVHTLPSSQSAVLLTPLHSPTLQISVDVHGLPSSQAAVLFWPARQTPAPLHTSRTAGVPVQALPSSHSVPEDDGACEQAQELAASTKSSVHRLPSSHTDNPTQVPWPSHRSGVVQRLGTHVELSQERSTQLPSSEVVDVAVAELLLGLGSVDTVVIVAVFEIVTPAPMQLFT